MTVSNDDSKAAKVRAALGMGDAKRTSTRKKSSDLFGDVNGSRGFIWSVLHPVRSTKFGVEYAITGMFCASAAIGIVYMVWGQPGSIQANWDRPLTWGAAFVDKVRNPVATMLGAGSEAVAGEAKNDQAYDPDSFE